MSTVAIPAARRRRRSLLGIVLVAVRSVVLGSLALLTAGFLLFVQTLEDAETPPHGRADGIVALTGGAERVSDAFDLLLGGVAQRLLVSGVNPNTTPLDLTRSVPAARRLLDCCVELGYAAEDTIGNARETRAWVRRHKLRSLIVVTSNYHMPRALAEIGDAAPSLALVPYPVVTARGEASDWWSDGQRLRLLGAEYVKYIIVLVRIQLFPSAPYREGDAA